MGMPKSREARQFYRCALLRAEEAEILRKAEKTSGAVYLAGFAIECILKALLLDVLTPADRDDMLKSFRGNRAHSFAWLEDQYHRNRGERFPPSIARAFTLVSSWSTDLRYDPRTIEARSADRFLNAAQEILQWASERL